MDPPSAKRLSKFLSFVLRHHPEAIGLQLDKAGWVEVSDLMLKAAEAGRPFTRAGLEDVVATNDKRRFAFSPDGSQIRASQGHSLPVDLELTSVQPPEVLFHGTGQGAVETILAIGLSSMARQHVHLSADPVTAEAVGRRHGRPVVLEVAAGRMRQDGIDFFVSANGVWLTPAVPPGYISQRPPNETRPQPGPSAPQR